jgi:hypothetical protein
MPSHREEFTRERIAEFEKLYDSGWRTIYRWHERGVKKGKPCPLHNPKEMPIWWAQTSSHTCPPKILNAARAAGGGTNGSSENNHSAEDPVEPMDFDSIDPDKVEAVAFQRSLVGALQVKMRKKALASQSIDFEQSQYLRAVKTLRELERDDRESKAHRGKFIPRDIVERDAALAADMLRQMHPVMERRVIERCPRLPPRQRADVLSALRHVFAGQARIFQRLNSPSAPDDFLAELAAA